MKERILEIAVRQMRRGGYENLNFAGIAEELGTSRANLHHHFKNKEGLATAATESYIQEQEEGLNKILREKDGDIYGVLAAIEDHLAEMVATGASGNGCILSQLLNDHEAPPSLRQLALDRLLVESDAIQAQIEKAKANGTLSSSADVESLTFRIMSMMLGIPQMSLMGTDLAKVRDRIKGSLVAIV